MDSLSLLFRGNLCPLLSVPASDGTVWYPLTRRASIKDIIEALGVPHTEIGSLLANGSEIDFNYQPGAGDHVEVLPHHPPVDPCRASLLRPQPLAAIRFLVDVNVAKLAPLLRMIGMDTAFDKEGKDARLAEFARNQQRILLTRDTALLKRKQVVFGHLLRSQHPPLQLREVVDLYGLRNRLRPFCRCLLCNGELLPVAKLTISHRLEPLTKKYYHDFRRCPECDKIYWPGSHREKMAALIAQLFTPSQPISS